MKKIKVILRNYSIITKKFQSEVFRYFDTLEEAEKYVSLWSDFPGVEAFISSSNNTTS